MRVARNAEELDADVVERPRRERGEEVAVEHDGGGVGELAQRQARRLAQRVVALGRNSIGLKNCPENCPKNGPKRILSASMFSLISAQTSPKNGNKRSLEVFKFYA